MSVVSGWKYRTVPSVLLRALLPVRVHDQAFEEQRPELEPGTHVDEPGIMSG